MARMIKNDYNGINILSFTQFNALGWVIHGFTTRLGGVSEGAYKSLNMGLHVGDDRTAVLENRRLALGALGLDYKAAVAGEQVHGVEIAKVTKGDISKGAEDTATALKGIDALVTDEAGVILTSYYADCVPVFLIDPEHRAVALVHSGWKGTIDKISSQTITYMEKTYGSRPESILAGIGPHIGPCCYEIDVQLAARFEQVFKHDDKLIIKGSGRYYLDLSRAVTIQLLDSGCISDHIYDAALCTSCDTGLFFSHRAECGRTGRSASIICITR